MNESHKPLEGSTPIPDYLTRQEQEYDPLPRLNNLIRKKITNLGLLNANGIDLLDNAIKATFDTAIDQGLKTEAIRAMGRYKKGKRLTKEGIDYKDELEKGEREISPVLKLADLIVNKLAGMDDLSDEQLEELDISINAAHKGAREPVEISKADALMTTFFCRRATTYKYRSRMACPKP